MKFGRRSIVNRAGALALALWLGGVGCLLCCEKTSADTQEGAAPQAAAHAAPSHEAAAVKAPAACPMHAAKSAPRAADVEARRDESASASSRASESASSCAGGPSAKHGAARCCRDKGQPVTLSFKPRVSLETAVVSLSNALTPPRVGASITHEPTPRGRLPDGGEIYLRCCILLI